MRDYYEVLGVPRDATASQIKRAYHKLAQQYHPDRNPDNSEAEDKFKEASNAYAVLSNDDKRARYDRFGHEGVGAGVGGQGFSSVEDIFASFGDLFGDFFGGRGRARGPAPGRDVEVPIELEFAEAVWGASKTIEVTKATNCEDCSGHGTKDGSPADACPQCDGAGQVLHSQGFFMVQATCPRCRGRGVSVTDPCGNCRGSGQVEEATDVKVTVPPGIDNGQQLRYAGKGEPSRKGGRPGNLYVTMHVKPDERFIREHQDVLTEVLVSVPQAVLGGTVMVPTLEDNCQAVEEMKIKAGTQSGDVMVRRGKGIPMVNGRGRGDHVVRLVVDIPKKLSKKEEELYRELAELTESEVSGPKKSLLNRIKDNLRD